MSGSLLKAAGPILAISLAISLPSSAHAADPSARALVGQAIAAQGGEAALRSAQIVEWDFEGYRDMVEQSERPEGPYIPEFRSVREIHDFAGGRFAQMLDQRVFPEFQFSSGIVADRSAAIQLFGKNRAPDRADTVAASQDLLAVSPEHLLLTAFDAADLRMAPATILQSVPQDVVAFSVNGSPAKLFLNRYTHLPTALDYSGPAARQDFWHFLGDVTMRTYYSYWWLGNSGVRLPMQWDIYRNGLHDMSLMATKVIWPARPDEALLQISPELRQAFAKQAAAASLPPKLNAAVEIGPGIAFIPGAWNISFVRQPDGIVILEAPISSAYSEQVIAQARKLYPGLPIKAVVTTSDSWPHIAGIRTYVALGVPIYCLDLNKPILTRLAGAHFSNPADELELHPRKPRFIPVSGKTVIGSGPTAIELYPLHGETGERQMIAYFPAQRLLYGSDPFQEGADGRYRTTQSVSELLDAAAREGLHPQRFFLMHVAPTDWSKLSETIAPANLKFPDGTLQ
jgi:hypothetical protein